MAYIGFDLDETLGRFTMAHYHTLFLQPHLVVYEGAWSGKYGTGAKRTPPIALSDTLKTSLDTAFGLFVDCLAQKEKQGLGLLRPGIVDMAKRLYALKQQGKVKSVLIYSNNGNLALLHLAGKLIEKLANAPGLFCNYIHWFHPSREAEVTYGRPGMATKSMAVLLEAFQSRGCGSEEPEIDKVYFFDDVLHPDIYRMIPTRYFQNPAYKYDADPAIIDECFGQALISSGLDKNKDYFEYISEIAGLNTLYDSLEEMNKKVYSFIQAEPSRKARKALIPNNTNFRKRFNRIFPHTISKANFQKSLQTVRRLEERLNRGNSLSNEENKQLSDAKTMITTFELQNPNTSGGKRRKTRKMRRRH